MIVFLNPTDRTITICDKIVTVYSWSQTKTLKSILSGNNVIYVTDAVETSGEEVLQVIQESMTEDDLGDQTIVANEQLYFHTTQSGAMMVSYANKVYTFKGAGDLRKIQDLPEGLLENCSYVVDGMKSGLFEIVGEEEKNQILEEVNAKKTDFHNKKNNILVDSGVSASDAAEGKKGKFSAKGSVDDPIEIDLSPGAGFKKGY